MSGAGFWVGVTGEVLRSLSKKAYFTGYYV